LPTHLSLHKNTKVVNKITLMSKRVSGKRKENRKKGEGVIPPKGGGAEIGVRAFDGQHFKSKTKQHDRVKRSQRGCSAQGQEISTKNRRGKGENILKRRENRSRLSLRVERNGFSITRESTNRSRYDKANGENRHEREEGGETIS